MSRAVFAFLILASALSSAVHVRFRFFPGMQKSMVYESGFSSSNKMELLDADGRIVKSEPIEGKNHSRWREKTLAVVNGVRTSFLRTYEEYGGLSGITLYFDRVKGHFVARPANGAAVPDKTLKEEASSEDSNPFAGDEAMLPREPVAIGATWAVDATPFIRDWTLFEIGRPSKGVAKLTAVRIEKSHRIATIVIDQQFEAVGTGDHQFDAPVKAALHAQYDACIDGTSTEYHSRTEVRFINAVQRTGDGHTIRETLNFKRWEDQHDVND